jgi:hypothetical protein
MSPEHLETWLTLYATGLLLILGTGATVLLLKGMYYVFKHGLPNPPDEGY